MHRSVIRLSAHARGTMLGMRLGGEPLGTTSSDERDEHSADSPLVTIGMPVYNGAAYVEQAIMSLLAQTEGDFVLHISDNYSEDATAEICLRLAAEDPRIHYQRQERNLGASGNFLHVLQAAHSPYFMWAAHDDTWEPDFLKVTLGMLRSSPEAVGCAVGRQGIIPETGLRWKLSPPTALSDTNPVVRSRGTFLAGGWHAIYGLYRRDALQLEPPVLHDVHFADGLFVFRMSLHGAYVVNRRTLQQYRDLGYSTKSVGPEAHLYSGNFIPATRLMWHYAGEPGLLSRHQRASIRRHILWKWFTFTRDWAARINLERGSRAYRGGQYPRLVIILIKQLFLRPSDLLNQARRRLGPGSGS